MRINCYFLVCGPICVALSHPASAGTCSHPLFADDVLVSVGTSPRSVAAGDLDGDGDLDLAVANSSSANVSVLLNDGSGTFARDVLYPVGQGPTAVAIGKLDADNDLDLAVANYPGDQV